VVTENLVVYGSPDEAEDTGALHVFAVGPAGTAAPATVIVTDPDTAEFPALSAATAYSVCVPAATLLAFQEMLYGEDVAVPINVVPA